MALFPLLLDPASYRACEIDLLRDDAARARWLDLFVSQFEHQLAAAASLGVAEARCAAARTALREAMERIRREPARHGGLDILRLDEVRRGVLVGHAIRDEFRAIKDRENDAALAALPEWLRGLDAASGASRPELLVRGILAGNLFDMGASATAAAFAGESPGFARALEQVPARPWFVDHLDRAAARLASSPPAHTVILADNAGADLLLGVLPLTRELLALGGRVVIAANAEPSLNDVTIGELPALVDRFAAVAGLDRERLGLVNSGSVAPLIDLADVSDELAAAAEGADLLVIFGMGRGLESNWSARFRCAAWRLAMVKDRFVARDLGAELFDAVCRYEDAGGP